MTREPDRLYNLLPSIHRIRDTENGYPLRSLLQVISEQVNLVEADIEQLYDNWFIETCEDWVVPYIGDLVGYQVVHEAGEPGDGASSSMRNRIVIPRRDVADTIRNRRRKGALALLEELAMDTARWPSRAVEFYRLLGWTQNLNHVTTGSIIGTADLRRGDSLDRLNGAFDEIAHTVDVRQVNGRRSPGSHNIPSVGLFVWRLKPYSVTGTPARLEDRQRHQYTFSILGNDTPLFTKTEREPSPTHIADEMNVAGPIRRRALEDRTADYYGEGKSFVIYRDAPNKAVPIEDIVVADLSGWAYQPTGHQVAVDPKLGRIAFSSRRPPQKGVWVSYHYGFSSDIGGGEYARPIVPSPNLIKVGGSSGFKRISDAVNHWRELRRKGKWPHVVIEIRDSNYYTEQIAIELYKGERLELRAAAGKRPVIRLLDFTANQPDAIQLIGHKRAFRHEGKDDEAKQETNDCDAKRGGRFILDGILISGRGLRVTGELESVTVRHSTLVPGWSLGRHCEPEYGTESSIEMVDTTARLTIEKSIVGTIQVIQNEITTDPLAIRITDSVLDATAPELEALGSPDCPVAHAILTIARSTVIGRVAVHAIDLAENSIFDGIVKVARRQIGCMRFCYATPESRTPRRFNCQPDLVIGAAQTPAAKASEERRVRPQFTSRRYGQPAYCQLADRCADEIKRGADDESEMGVFHDLFQPQREANLRARLSEFTPARMDVGVIFAT